MADKISSAQPRPMPTNIGGEALEASDHLQPVKRVGNAASYGTDFGHGQTGGPRFRVFIPADPLPAKQ